jgi:hypothetical protein
MATTHFSSVRLLLALSLLLAPFATAQDPHATLDSHVADCKLTDRYEVASMDIALHMRDLSIVEIDQRVQTNAHCIVDRQLRGEQAQHLSYLNDFYSLEIERRLRLYLYRHNEWKQLLKEDEGGQR